MTLSIGSHWSSHHVLNTLKRLSISKHLYNVKPHKILIFWRKTFTQQTIYSVMFVFTVAPVSTILYYIYIYNILYVFFHLCFIYIIYIFYENLGGRDDVSRILICIVTTIVYLTLSHSFSTFLMHIHTVYFMFNFKLIFFCTFLHIFFFHASFIVSLNRLTFLKNFSRLLMNTHLLLSRKPFIFHTSKWNRTMLFTATEMMHNIRARRNKVN